MNDAFYLRSLTIHVLQVNPCPVLSGTKMDGQSKACWNTCQTSKSAMCCTLQNWVEPIITCAILAPLQTAASCHHSSRPSPYWCDVRKSKMFTPLIKLCNGFWFASVSGIRERLQTQSIWTASQDDDKRCNFQSKSILEKHSRQSWARFTVKKKKG